MKAELKTLTMPEYIALKAVSSGLLHRCVTRSPLHAKFAQDNPSEPSKESDLGSTAHAILLEGSEDCIVVCDFADWRKNEAKEAREAARAEGKIPMLAHKMDDVREMVAAARKHIEASPLAEEWAGGGSELTGVWEQDGLLCKARFDRINQAEDVVFDYKTSGESVNPNSWVRHALSMGYDIQAAHYIRGYHAITGRTARYVWLAQETEAPYSCCFMDMAPDLAAYADSRMMRGFSMWARSVKANRWEGYPMQVCSLAAPGWAMAVEDEARIASDLDSFTQSELKDGIPL